jgi:TRAP-type C4-dicarboxylate transport system permease small subunit
MRFAGSGRFVFIAQWVLAVLLPIFFFIGRDWVGADVGWLGLVGIVYGVFTILHLLVPPLLTLFDPEARRKRATRMGYDIATILLWLAIVVGALTVPDSGDSGHLDSALTTWTGVSYETSEAIFYATAIVLGIAYLAAFVLAVVGIVRGRRVAS